MTETRTAPRPRRRVVDAAPVLAEIAAAKERRLAEARRLTATVLEHRLDDKRRDGNDPARAQLQATSNGA